MDDVARRLERLEIRVTLLEQGLCAARTAAAAPAAAQERPVAPPIVPPAATAPIEQALPPPPAPPAVPEPVVQPELVAELAPPRAPEPLPAPAVVAATAPPIPPASQAARRAVDLERFFGLAVMGRVGIAAVVLAASYFAQLGWGRLGPVARVCGIYAVAVAMVGVGAWLRARVAPRYTALLWGGGVALAYVAGVAAKLHYDLIGATPALILLCASAALGQGLARVLRLEAMAIVALAGAYSAPLLVGHDSPLPTAFYVYLAALHAWAAWTEHAWGWRNSRRLAVTATIALAGAWLATHVLPAPGSLWLHVEAMWLVLAAPELLAAGRGAVSPVRWRLVLIGGGAVQAALLGWSAAQGAALTGGLIAGSALLALAALLQRSAPAPRPALAMLADLGAATLAFGVRVHADGAWQLVGEAVAAAFAVLLTRRWTAARDVGPVLAGAFASACALDVEPSPAGHARAALALLVPIALVDVGGAAAGRLAGLGLGALVMFFGVRLGDSLTGAVHLWSPIAWVPVAGWLGLCSAVAARRGCAVTANVAHVLLYGGRFAIASLAVWSVGLLAGAPLPPHAVPALLAAGLCALGAGAAVNAWGAPDRLRGHARELVELGGLMAVLAGYCAWPGAIEPGWTRLSTLVAVGALLLAARRRLGGGELAVAGAAAFGIAAVAPAEPALQSRLQMALAALLPAMLVWRGSAGFGAPVGAALGAVAAGIAVRLGHSLAGPLSWWAPAAASAAIVWATLAAALRPEPRTALVAAAARGLAPLALAVPAIWCAQALLLGWQQVHAASGAVLAIGALALAVEAWRTGRRSSAGTANGPARSAVVAVPDLAAVLAVLGAFALPSGLADAGGTVGFDHPWLRLGGIAAIALSLLATRRWTGTGELAPGLAAAIAAFTVLGEPVGAGSRAHAAIALGLLAALVVCARAAALRSAALVAAAAVACFAATRAFAFTGEHALWTSIGLGIAGGLAGGGALLSAWRRDRICLTTAAVLLCALGVGWSVIAWRPAAAVGDAGPVAFVNLRCACALLLIALLDFARRRLPAGTAPLERGTFVAITLGFAWLAGLVEMLALVRTWPAGWSDATISLYSVLYAAGLLWTGFRRRRPALRYAGLGGFAIVVVKVGLWDLAALALPLRVLVTGVLGVVLLLGAWAYARNRRTPPAPHGELAG